MVQFDKIVTPEVAKDLFTALDLLESIADKLAEIETADGIMSFIGTLADTWCDMHGADVEAFRIQLNDMMKTAHEFYGGKIDAENRQI